MKSTLRRQSSAAVTGKGAGTGWWWHTPDDTLDKMDEDILVRDTRIYLHTVWRLLTDRVLPLDYRAHAGMLSGELDKLQAAVGERFDLAPLKARAERLAGLAGALSAVAGKVDDAAAERINAGLMAVSRALVPVDYTLGDRFTHDPALAQNAYPILNSVRLLAGAGPSEDEFEFVVVQAMRARNRVAQALREANVTLTQTLADLSVNHEA